ncbi:hypothetical protein ANN_23304 [Periplaneta americana]|uniref:Uncharacterized protein n=1 Tax=Periplaneta americana TaxID=6978 RepID=A0ABQ8SLY6_PERAM|nr:hypothetical protein ANN_23304 [Periplaneta americana]
MKCLGKYLEPRGMKLQENGGSYHNAELHALYSSPDIIRNIKSRRLRWARHVARMGESRNAYRVLVGKPEGKRPLRRQRCRWENNINMDLREVGYDYGDWINLAQDRDLGRSYVRAAMNLRVPLKPVTDFPSRLKFLAYLVSAAFQLFIYCWFGNELHVESMVLQDHIFHCGWYNEAEYFGPSIRIIMENVKRPLKLSAGKIYTITLETFMTTIDRIAALESDNVTGSLNLLMWHRRFLRLSLIAMISPSKLVVPYPRDL